MSKTSRARTDRIILVAFGLAVAALYIASFHLDSITGVGLNNLISSVRFLVDKSIKPLFIGVFIGTFLSFIFPHKYLSFLLAGSGLKPVLNSLWLGVFTKKCTYQDMQTILIQSKLGVSIGSSVASLLISPVNSFSFLFLILSLFGTDKGMLLILSIVFIALFTGIIFDLFHYYKVIPRSEVISRVNPNFDFLATIKNDFKLVLGNLKSFHFIKDHLGNLVMQFFVRIQLSLKWYFLGIFLSGLIVGGLGEELIQDFGKYYFLVLIAIIVFSALIEILDEGMFILAFTLYYFSGGLGFSLVLIVSNIVFELLEASEAKLVFSKKTLILFSIIPIILSLILGFVIK